METWPVGIGWSDVLMEERMEHVAVAGAVPCCSVTGLGSTVAPLLKMYWMRLMETGCRQRRSPAALEVSVVKSFWGCSRSLDRKLAEVDPVDFLTAVQ